MYNQPKGHYMKRKKNNVKVTKSKSSNDKFVQKWTTDELMELGRS